jgi:acyl-CoA thioester hydrolase
MNDPKALSDFKLKIQLRVAWADMDIFGHVNSTYFFRYFESARIQYYESLGLLDYFKIHNIGAVIKYVSCDYFVPIKYPDTLIVGARVTKIGKDEISMEYYIKSKKNGLSAYGESKIVFYSFKIDKRIDLPKYISESIVAFENF